MENTKKKIDIYIKVLHLPKNADAVSKTIATTLSHFTITSKQIGCTILKCSTRDYTDIAFIVHRLSKCSSYIFMRIV